MTVNYFRKMFKKTGKAAVVNVWVDGKEFCCNNCAARYITDGNDFCIISGFNCKKKGRPKTCPALVMEESNDCL